MKSLLETFTYNHFHVVSLRRRFYGYIDSLHDGDFISHRSHRVKRERSDGVPVKVAGTEILSQLRRVHTVFIRYKRRFFGADATVLRNERCRGRRGLVSGNDMRGTRFEPVTLNHLALRQKNTDDAIRQCGISHIAQSFVSVNRQACAIGHPVDTHIVDGEPCGVFYCFGSGRIDAHDCEHTD